nr:MAG TPA: Phorbol-12-myristate-13-acetate-induced [Bacteriophage sp.]
MAADDPFNFRQKLLVFHVLPPVKKLLRTND